MTISKVCLKSPTNKNTTTLNNWLLLLKSFKVILTASTDILFAIVHSSHTTKTHSCKTLALWLFLNMPHTRFFIQSALITILKIEWAVFPLGSKVEGIPDDRTAIGIFFFYMYFGQ